MVRARVPRRIVPRIPGALPYLALGIAAASVAICFAIVAAGLFSATVIQGPKPKQTPAVIESKLTPPTAPSPDEIAERLRMRITSVRRAADHVDVAVEQTRTRIAALDQRKSELQDLVEKRRTVVHQAEDAVRRTEAQQKEAVERRDRLAAEAAELEKRIAALNASIVEAQRAVEARPDRLNAGAQLIECVRDGVVLRPQQVRIPTSALASGALANAVRRRGAYFVVRPDGFSTFLIARGIARGTGALVLAEPRVKD